MGRPKIKTIESDFDLSTVKLPEEGKDLPVLDEATEELVEKQVKAKTKKAKEEKNRKEKNPANAILLY